MGEIRLSRNRVQDELHTIPFAWIEACLLVEPLMVSRDMSGMFDSCLRSFAQKRWRNGHAAASGEGIKEEATIMALVL